MRFLSASLRATCIVFLASLLAAFTLAGSAQSAPRIWAGNHGTNPTFWDIGTTNNWDGGATTFANGDDVSFTNAGTGTTVNLQTSVSPNSTIINSTTNTYTFNGGDITSGSVSVSGTRAPVFTQNSLSFGGGTSVNNVRVDYQPTSAGAHSFGSGPITLNTGAGSWFNFDPAVVGATLTNNFIVNGSVTWRNPGAINNAGVFRPKNPGTSGVRTGTITLNGTLSLEIGTSGCVGCDLGTNLKEQVLLTGNRTIFGGERFYGTATTISGDINSVGGPHDITLSHRGDNSDWEYFIRSDNATSTTGWDVKNIRRTTFSGGNGTVVFEVNEQQFFQKMKANGGMLFHAGAGMRFHDEFTPVIGANTTANINFGLIVEPDSNGQGTGFRVNNKFNVQNGGLLGGNGIYRSGPEGGSVTPFNNALDVDVFAGGEIAPGNPEVNGGVGKMTVQGDVTFVNGGQLTIQVDGTAVAGTNYDQLVSTVATGVGGGGVVSGLENANLVVDFDPSLTFAALQGKTLTILTSNSLLSSEFLSVSDNFNNAGIGVFSYDVLFQGNQILLTNFQLTVPEPNSLLLMLGVLGCGMLRRRKR
jgi:hypothetical protein